MYSFLTILFLVYFLHRQRVIKNYQCKEYEKIIFEQVGTIDWALSIHNILIRKYF